MAGEIRRTIDKIIEQRTKGNATIAVAIKTKLILKGLSPDKFTSASPDDPAILAKVRSAAAELGVSL